MKKLMIGILACILIVSFPLSSLAAPSGNQADKNTPNIPNKQDIERIDYIHYAKPSGNPNSSKNDPGYKLMGVKWRTAPVQYYYNTLTTPIGLDSAAMISTLQTSSEVWDSATSKELFVDTVLPTSDPAAVYGVFDQKNLVMFGSYPGNNNVIAITSVWYNRRTKEIVEFDMLFNTYYLWGNSDNVSDPVMDIQNIATHELGHAVGLSDIYSSAYSDVTMYGYSGYDDTAERTLETPDILGLQSMYGK